MGSLLIPKHRVSWFPKETGDLKTFLSPRSESPWPSGYLRNVSSLKRETSLEAFNPLGNKAFAPFHMVLWIRMRSAIQTPGKILCDSLTVPCAVQLLQI